MQLTARLKQWFPPALKRPLRDARSAWRALPARTRRQKEQLLASASLSDAERDLLRRVDSRISPRDEMYTGRGDHYFGVGLSAVRCIEEALRVSGAGAPRRVLDLPCGHGRVLRFLVQQFPQARFTACEIDRDGVDYCARIFGAGGAYSVPDFDRLRLEERFDLIWCGSLATHLEAPALEALFRFFARQLAPGGIVLFSVHGDYVAERMPRGEFDYGLTAAQVREVTASYARTGFGYGDYPHMAAYGISLTSPAWVRARVAEVGELEELCFTPRGWDQHQDVFAFRRRG